MAGMLEVPLILFNRWQPWTSRSHPAMDLDVTPELGILGVYLLAHCPEAPPSGSPVANELPAEVVYVGMSRHTEQRLARHHKAVARYKERFADASCRHLYFASWNSDWTSWPNSTNPVQRAHVLLYERALIALYANRHGRVPQLNRW